MEEKKERESLNLKAVLKIIESMNVKFYFWYILSQYSHFHLVPREEHLIALVSLQSAYFSRSLNVLQHTGQATHVPSRFRRRYEEANLLRLFYVRAL